MFSDSLPPLAPPAAPRLFGEVLASHFLGRNVELSIICPPGGLSAGPQPVLYLNDGQDCPQLHLLATLQQLYSRRAVRPFVVVAIHANEQRVHEYGTAGQPDYLGRGSRAGAYADFVLHELLPFAQARYHASAKPDDVVMAGFSLGGLSAFDLVWHHPEAFTRAGVFSGSFWWRARAVGAGYTPADRIMHSRVRARQPHSNHQFWLQAGTLDERNDRNGNGVIDSLEDCLDLVDALAGVGLNIQQNLRYVQVEGGRHDAETWSRVMPDFLVWAFGQEGSISQLPAPLPIVRLSFAPERASAIGPPMAEKAGLSTHPLVLPNAVGPTPAQLPAVPVSYISTSNTSPMSITRPVEGDFLPYSGSYINLVPIGADPRTVLREQPKEIHAIFDDLSEAQAEKAYAPGKWTLKEMLLHQIDSERVFAYRALRFARGDSQDLRGFEQDDFVAHSQANARSIADLLAEYDATRAATLALFDSFGEEQLNRRGTANGGPATVRALLYIVAGHERHHLNIVRERYQPIL